MNKRNAPWLLIVAAVMWGSSFVASKICIRYGMMPFETIFIRFFCGAILIWLVFHKGFHPYNRSTVRSGVLLGLSTACGFSLEMTGLVTVDASKAAFLTATNIVILSILYCLVYRIRPTVFSVSAALLAFLGVGILSFNGNSFSPMAFGDLLLLGAACTYAINSMLGAAIDEKDSRVQVSFIQFLTAAAIMGVLTWIQGSGGPYPPEAIGATAYLVIGPTVICYIIKNSAVQHVTPVRCSLLLATQSVFCAVLSTVILGDMISGRMLLGSSAIGVAILLEILHPVQKGRKGAAAHQSE